MESNPGNKEKVKVNYSFNKDERLCSNKLIDSLFREGKSVNAYPLKFVFLFTSLPVKSPVQVAFTVGKRNFKKAVHRNRIKRFMREAYRLNKHELYRQLKKNQLVLFVLFTGKEIPEYKSIEKALKNGLVKIAGKIPEE